MATATSVVTAARFEQGLTWADFFAEAAVNRDRFEQYYNDDPLSDQDLAFFRRAAGLSNGPARILALAEAWCSDVYRELPTVARIAEATGIELRIFLRDENSDIMDEFLSNEGKARAIPVFAFYTGDMRYITHFTERPQSAHAELAATAEQVRSELNLPAAVTLANMEPADRQKYIREVIARVTPRFPEWRKDSIREMRQLLSKALDVPDAQKS
jgi:thioredoxin family protein